MREGRNTAALRARLAAFVALLAGLCAASTAPAATPSLFWDGVRQVGIHCLVQSSTLSLSEAEQTALCDKVRSATSRGAPMRVIAVDPGHPAMIRHDTVVLLFHGAIERGRTGRTLAFSLRPYRPGSAGEVYFGAAPRAVALSGRNSVDAPLRAALGEILPWQNAAAPVGRPL